MIDSLKSYIPIIIAVVAFCLGVSYGTSKTEKEWKESQNSELLSYKTEVSTVLREKDEKISRLLFDLDAARKSHSDIMRKLDSYKNRKTTLAECRNDRTRMADVAGRMDDYSQRLLTRTRSMIDSKSGQ